METTATVPYTASDAMGDVARAWAKRVGTIADTWGDTPGGLALAGTAAAYGMVGVPIGAVVGVGAGVWHMASVARAPWTHGVGVAFGTFVAADVAIFGVGVALAMVGAGVAIAAGAAYAATPYVPGVVGALAVGARHVRRALAAVVRVVVGTLALALALAIIVAVVALARLGRGAGVWAPSFADALAGMAAAIGAMGAARDIARPLTLRDVYARVGDDVATAASDAVYAAARRAR